MAEDPIPHVAQETAAAAKAEKAYIMYAVWFKRPNGAAHYSEYLEHASPIAQKYGARRVDSLIPVEPLNGGWDPDYIYVVEWPHLDAYYAFLEDVQYRAVATRLPEAASKTVVLYCRRHR